jgi:hypothetical protein
VVAVARSLPSVAHVKPFPRAGLMLREQRQQARRGEPQTDLLARPLLRDNHRPYEALGCIADGVAVNHPSEDLSWLRSPGRRPVVPVWECAIPVPHQLGSLATMCAYATRWPTPTVMAQHAIAGDVRAAVVDGSVACAAW